MALKEIVQHRESSLNLMKSCMLLVLTSYVFDGEGGCGVKVAPYHAMTAATNCTPSTRSDSYSRRYSSAIYLAKK
jgi:hypothetical protein